MTRKRKKDDIDNSIIEKYKNVYLINPALYNVDFPYMFVEEKNHEDGEYKIVKEKKISFKLTPNSVCIDILTLLSLIITISSIWTKIPWIPFAILTFVFSFWGLTIRVNKDTEKQLEELDKVRSQMVELINPNRMYDRLGVDVICLQVSENLIPVADPDGNGTLLPKTAALRQRLADTLGYIIPNIRIQDSRKLDTNMYTFLIRGKTVFKGRLSKDEISDTDCKKIIDSLEEICIKYAPQIVESMDILKLIELVKSYNPILVNNLIPMFLCVADLKIILTNLIVQKISIRDIVFIFEILNNHARYTRDVDELTNILKKELNFELY